MLLLIVVAHIALLPYVHIGGEGPERILAGYYLAGYNIDVTLTQLDTRGELFIQSVISLIVRICDAFCCPVEYSVQLSLYTFPLINLLAIIFAYVLGSDLFDEEVGFYFSVLLGLSYIYWYFSNQTRITTICSTLMLISTYIFWKCLQENSKWYWFPLLGIFSALAFEAEYFASFLFIFYILFLVLTRKNLSMEKIEKFSLGVIAIIFTLLPWLYLNTVHTGSPFGPMLNLMGGGWQIRSTTFYREGYWMYLSYIKRIHFFLPFPNFVIFIYGVCISIMYFLKKREQNYLYALLFFIVMFCGTSTVVAYYCDWYPPIFMPSLLLMEALGLREMFAYLRASNLSPYISRYICLLVLLLCVVSINQIHPLIFIYFEDLKINFYDIRTVLLGFAYPKILSWSNPWRICEIISYLEGIDKISRPLLFNVMLYLHYVLIISSFTSLLYLIFPAEKSSFLAHKQMGEGFQQRKQP